MGVLKIMLKKSASVYIIIKLLKPKGKEKILKAAKHKNDTLSIRRKQFKKWKWIYFQTEAKKKWHNIFKCWKKIALYPEFYYSVKMPFKNNKNIMTLSDEGKLRVFVSRRTTHERMTNGSSWNWKKIIKEF